MEKQEIPIFKFKMNVQDENKIITKESMIKSVSLPKLTLVKP